MLRKSLALGATFTLAGLLTGVSALPTTAAPADSFSSMADTLLADPAVQGVARNAAGQTVVYVVGDAPRALSARSNVVVETLPEVFSAYDATDVIAGSGYLVPDGTRLGSCSTAFAAWSPSGEPAILSAGHCAQGATATAQAYLSKPSTDPAAGGPGFQFKFENRAFGQFVFTQFGGPDNGLGTPDASSTDISVIKVTDGATKPLVTDWTTAATDDLAASTTKITRVGTPEQGKPVSKSGRTTGVTTSGSTVHQNGYFRIYDDAGDHLVKGFLTENFESMPGDSGSAVYQGETAVGILSGGSGNLTVSAELVSGLALTGGYTVQLAQQTPTIGAALGSDIASGSPITGTAAAGATVQISLAGAAPFEVTADGAGNWSFPAPNTLGNVAFTAQAVNGFDRSELVNHNVNIVLGAVLFTSPTPGSTVHSAPAEITGTGFPGAVVELTGDIIESAVVAADGTWSVPLDVEFGDYAVSAVQISGGMTSPVAELSFSYAPQGALIEAPVDGSSFLVGQEPTVVTGKAVAGADVTAALASTMADGTVINADLSATAAPAAARMGVANTPFSFDLPTLGLGSHTITVTETIGARVLTTTSTIQIVNETVTPGENTPAGKTPGANLADTGAQGLPLLLTGAGVLLVVGGIAFLVTRRKRVAVDSE